MKFNFARRDDRIIFFSSCDAVFIQSRSVFYTKIFRILVFVRETGAKIYRCNNLSSTISVDEFGAAGIAVMQ